MTMPEIRADVETAPLTLRSTDLRDLLSRATDTVAFCRERAEGYQAFRQSAITPVALDRAADAIENLLSELDGARERIAELEAAKWQVKHVDTMNDMVAMALARDEAEARVVELEAVLAGILPSKLCGESWGLPDDETVSIVVTFGALARARALGEKKS